MNIDFLPAEYHQRHARRHGQPTRIVAVAALAMLLALAAVAQHRAKSAARSGLAQLQPLCDAAARERSVLAAAQVELKNEQRAAELYAALKHPWPRTQLLAALVVALPENIHFDQLAIVREAVRPTGPTNVRGPERPGEQEDLTKLSPVERDLRRVRDEMDKLRTVVRISGTVGDSAALHAYLDALQKNDLVLRADLDSLEAMEKDGGSRFRATIVVRGGYGQPGGPVGESSQFAAGRGQ